MGRDAGVLRRHQLRPENRPRMEPKMINEKLAAAIDQSRDYLIAYMIEKGVPIGVNAVRCDITLHTARGWQPTMTGEIVQFSLDAPDLPEASHASHHSWRLP